MLAFAGGDSRIEIPTAPTKNPKSDDAELLKDLRGLGKPPLFDGNDTDVSFFLVSEDDSILLRHMDDVVDTGPDEHHRAIGEIDNQMNQHIDMPQNQHTDKVADESVAVQRQVSQRTTETKAPELQWDDQPGGDADKDVQGEAITKYCWSEGEKTVSICKQRIFKFIDLAHEITGVKVAQKTWHKLLDERQHATKSSHIAPTKEIVEDDTAKTANSKFQESIKGLNDKHSKFEMEQWNVTDTPQFVISTIDHGEQIDHRNTGKGKSIHTGEGKGKHVDVVETSQPSGTVSTRRTL